MNARIASPQVSPWVDGEAKQGGAGGRGLAKGALYSPDLNPIEQASPKFKAVLRKAAERTREGLNASLH